MSVITQGRRGCFLSLNVIFLALQPSWGFAQEYAALSAIPRAQDITSETTLYLRLVVNGQEDSEIVPVTVRKDRYRVEAGVLARNHVKTGQQQSGLVEVDSLPEVSVDYEAASQQLRLTVPDSWLPEQKIGGDPLLSYSAPQGNTGLLFNYDSYYLDAYRGSRTLTTWMEQRFFSKAGVVSNTGTYRITSHSGNEGDAANRGYLRYDTEWRYSDEANMVSWQVGDFVSNALTWSNSARMGGLRVSRNFTIRPDLVTYPLMQYSGTAAVPGTVELFINGYKSSSSTINAGPFTLTNVPYINGAGEATVVTTDALGRQVTTNVPFYVSNTLLRDGLSDFDASFGSLRKNYGTESASYSDTVFSGLYRYGLNNWLTLSTHAEGMRGLGLGGLGSDVAVGHWGTFSSSFSKSHSQKKEAPGQTARHGDGSQYTLGYAYYSSVFSIAAQHAARSRAFQDLLVHTENSQMSTRADQVTFSAAPFGSGHGTLGLGYFDIRAHDGTRTRLGNLSYTQSLWDSSSLYLALNKTFSDGGYSAQLQLIVPFANGSNATGSVQRDSRGRYSERMTINRAMPTDGGMGWDLAWGAGSTQYRQANLAWKGQSAMMQGGIWGESGRYNRWGDLSGSLIYMDNALFAANRINDAFIVVNTNGYADIPVRYENQLIGKTNGRGHILVPWASAWYPAKIEIDTLDLPANADVSEVEKRVTVREGSGSLVTFPVQIVREANITLTDRHGTPLKVGTPVTELRSGQSTLVGYGGQVWFSHLHSESELLIHLPDGIECRKTFTLPQAANGIYRAGPLACPFSSPESQEPEQ